MALHRARRRLGDEVDAFDRAVSERHEELRAVERRARDGDDLGTDVGNDRVPVLVQEEGDERALRVKRHHHIADRIERGGHNDGWLSGGAADGVANGGDDAIARAAGAPASRPDAADLAAHQRFGSHVYFQLGFRRQYDTPARGGPFRKRAQEDAISVRFCSNNTFIECIEWRGDTLADSPNMAPQSPTRALCSQMALPWRTPVSAQRHDMPAP